MSHFLVKLRIFFEIFGWIYAAACSVIVIPNYDIYAAQNSLSLFQIEFSHCRFNKITFGSSCEKKAHPYIFQKLDNAQISSLKYLC